MPFIAEIQLDPNNSHDFRNVAGGLVLHLEGEHGLSVRVQGRREDWVSLVQRLVSWGLLKLDLKGVVKNGD